jgi:amidophosphoribosyltransferase
MSVQGSGFRIQKQAWHKDGLHPGPRLLNPDDDHPREECGVFGISNAHDAAAHAALGLHALQHRGQEAAGIISFDGKGFYAHRAQGLVSDTFNTGAVIAGLPGEMAIGHVRYSTAGGNDQRNIQPVYAELQTGGFAIAHNGNLTNAMQLRRELVAKGSIFQSTMDTEAILHLVAVSRKPALVDRLTEALQQVQGAYALVAMAEGMLIGVRDPNGVRPLVIGRLRNAFILASETCALDIIGADYVRDVAPGEMVVIRDHAIESLRPFTPTPPRFCIFEYVYFARPDSHVEGRGVYEVRKSIGRELARERAIPADLVVPVPDSGVPAAIGYAQGAGIPFELGIIRNHYVGRTFIEPTDHVRNLGVKLKHNANPAVLKGKRVILVDDSIVRGTTSKKIVTMVRDAGASEVHLCIASPPTTHSCFYGVDTPEQSKLLAHLHSVEEMAALIGVDSLTFLSIDGLYRALGEAKRSRDLPQYCDACFTGDYPIALSDFTSGMHDQQATALSEYRKQIV